MKRMIGRHLYLLLAISVGGLGELALLLRGTVI